MLLTPWSITYVGFSKAWPDPFVYEGSGPQRILNLCHTYMALGGARLAVELMASYVLVAEKILPHRQKHM